METKEIIDMLRREARRMDDKATAFTQEGILLRETAAKLEELQIKKEGNAN